MSEAKTGARGKLEPGELVWRVRGGARPTEPRCPCAGWAPLLLRGRHSCCSLSLFSANCGRIFLFYEIFIFSFEIVIDKANHSESWATIIAVHFQSIFITHKETLYPLVVTTPPLQATTSLISFPTELPTQGISCKWSHI